MRYVVAVAVADVVDVVVVASSSAPKFLLLLLTLLQLQSFNADAMLHPCCLDRSCSA